MLAVQQYLKSYGLEKLTEELGIVACHHETESLVILNYSQINSRPKDHPVVRECRALCLNSQTFDIIGLAFKRFFNLGEHPLSDNEFDWNNFTAQEKIDGSCLPVVHFDGRWRLHSRGGFGQSEINGSGYTWESLFFPLLQNLKQIPTNYSLVLEGTSLYNKIVVKFPTMLFLLTVFNRDTSEELSIEASDEIAKTIGVQRPKIHKFIGQESTLQWIKEQFGKDTEGLVLKDVNGIRLKIKVPEYVALHHLLGGGNLFLPQYLVPICLAGELDEIKAAFPELIPHIEKINNILNTAYTEAKSAYEEASLLTTQKMKAILLQSRTKLCAPSFTAWKTKRSFDEVWRDSANLLVKLLF